MPILIAETQYITNMDRYNKESYVAGIPTVLWLDAQGWNALVVIWYMWSCGCTFVRIGLAF